MKPYTPEKTEQNHPWDEFIRTIIFAILLAVFFRSVAYEPFHIPSGSMKSTLLVGDYLFVSKYSYGYSRYSFPFGLPIFKGRIMEMHKPERGDVVVFRVPSNPRIDFIKRLVGLPGDKIEVKNSIVYINGEPLKRRRVDDFVDSEDLANVHSLPRFEETLPEGKQIHILQEANPYVRPNDIDPNNTGVYVIPEGHYFMMGDNRDNSRDSRFPDTVGYVPEENLIGRAEIIFFSTDGSAKWGDPTSWFTSLRVERFFNIIH